MLPYFRQATETLPEKCAPQITLTTVRLSFNCSERLGETGLLFVP